MQSGVFFRGSPPDPRVFPTNGPGPVRIRSLVVTHSEAVRHPSDQPLTQAELDGFISILWNRLRDHHECQQMEYRLVHPDANAFQSYTHDNACRLLVYTPTNTGDYCDPPKESHWRGPQPGFFSRKTPFIGS